MEDTRGEKNLIKGPLSVSVRGECPKNCVGICVRLWPTGYTRDTEEFYNPQRQEMGQEQQPHSEQNSLIMYFIKLAFKGLQRTAEREQKGNLRRPRHFQHSELKALHEERGREGPLHSEEQQQQQKNHFTSKAGIFNLCTCLPLAGDCFLFSWAKMFLAKDREIR